MPGEKSRFGPKLNVNPNALKAVPRDKEPGIVSELLEPAAKPGKGGRPKGIPKTKKTFYLASDMGLFERVRLDLARNAGVMPKDESDTVDLALALLATLAAQPGHEELIKSVNKKRAAKTEL